MLLTEAEARRKTCPSMTYCVNEADILQNHREVAIHCQSKCEASDCMSWRWAYKDQILGYCGRAGIPRELGV